MVEVHTECWHAVDDTPGLHHFELCFVPYAGYPGITEFAAISHQVIRRNKITTALNQQVFAVVAVGIVALMFGHVPK